MKITHHGGQCCAIKHIHGLYGEPSRRIRDVFGEGELEGGDLKYLSYDRIGEAVKSNQNIFTGDVEELFDLTMGEVFDIYLRFLMQVRPYGLVEATIVPTHGEAARINSLFLSDREFEVSSDSSSDILPVFDDDDESVTSTGRDTSEQPHYQMWAEFLQARGFRCVSVVPNTNSGNMVHVYHLIMDGKWHKKVSKAGKLDCFNVKKEK